MHANETSTKTENDKKIYEETKQKEKTQERQYEW